MEQAASLVRGSYVVVHPGTGDQLRTWPSERWSQLIARLIDAGERVVITGRGELDERVAADLHAMHPTTVNLVGKVEWSVFRAIVANASLLIGVNSVAAHVAAADRVPAVVIMAAMTDPEYWRPLGSQVTVLTHAVPCAPCFRKNGCASLACVRDVSVGEVFGAYESLHKAARTTPAASAVTEGVARDRIRRPVT
jgi:ADP-heptose:LPS heptosyltransferase